MHEVEIDLACLLVLGGHVQYLPDRPAYGLNLVEINILCGERQ